VSKFLLLCALATACAAVVGRSSAEELTQDDYEIWNAAIRGHEPERVVYVWHTVEPLKDLQRLTLAGAFKNFPEARPTAERWGEEPAELEINQLIAAAERVPLRFTLPTGYALLSAAMLEERVGYPPKPNWILNPNLIPDAEAVCRLTRPVIRGDGRAAYLVYLVSTERGAALMTCTLHRDPRDARWRLGQCGGARYTDWKDGKRVYEDQKLISDEPCSCH
jgi:hypothetical protein